MALTFKCKHVIIKYINLFLQPSIVYLKISIRPSGKNGKFKLILAGMGFTEIVLIISTILNLDRR